MDRKKGKIKNRFIKFKPKLIFLAVNIFSMLLFLSYRLTYISIVKGDEYEIIAIEQQLRELDKVIYPKRGEILDKNGNKIASSVTTYKVIFNIHNYHSKENFLSEEKKLEYLKKIGQLTGIELSKLEEYVAKDSNGTPHLETKYKIIKKGLTYEKGRLFKKENFPSNIFYLENEIKRIYPNNNLASQVVGHIMESEIWGLEKQYNQKLMGEYGRIYQKFNKDGQVEPIIVQEINGAKIVTTIDITIQSRADEIIEKYAQKHRTENASMIVVEPSTGKILAMANYQNYNNNDPTNIEYINGNKFKDAYNELENGKERTEKLMNVWKNFSISDTYEPGSTFKAVVLSAALEEKIITTEDVYYCPGYKMVGETMIKCWTYETGGHGKITLEEGIAQSCNVAAIEINQAIGRYKFYEYQKDFGFGELTGIDLPNEVSANNFIYSLDQLNSVELATSSMGQGFNSTAIQNTMAFAAIINGGELLRPYIAMQEIREDGTSIELNGRKVIKRAISKKTSEIMRKMLQSVVSEDGTGKKAIKEGYNIGGKTGTAEQGDREKNLRSLSFFGYFPVEEPKYLIYTVLHLPDDYIKTSANAVEPTKEIIDEIITYKNIPKSKIYNLEKEETTSLENLIVDDYIGRNIVKLSTELSNKGIEYEILEGGSVVRRQVPSPGSLVKRGTKIFLYLEVENISSNDVITDGNIYEVEDGNKKVELLIETQNLEGLEKNEAIKILDALGFTYQVVVRTATKDIVGEKLNKDSRYVVVSQSPKENILLPEGTQIKIIVEKE